MIGITSPCPPNPFLMPANASFTLLGQTFYTTPITADKPDTPEGLAIFQHAVSTHLIKPPVSPYDITDEVAETQAENGYRQTITSNHWNYGASICGLVITKW